MITEKIDGRLVGKTFLVALLGVALVFPFQMMISYSAKFVSLPLGNQPLLVLLALGILFLCLAAIQKDLMRGARNPNQSIQILTLAVGRRRHIGIWRAVGFTFLSCLVSYLMGLAFGGEGPSVYLGALMGVLLFKDDDDKDFGIALGGAIGFCLAFNNPLAGMLSSLEGKRKVGWRTYLLVFSGCLSAYVLYSLLKGFVFYSNDWGHFYLAFLYGNADFYLEDLSWADFKYYGLLVLVALAIAGFGFAYERVVIYVRGFLRHGSDPFVWSTLIAGALIALLTKAFEPSALGTGALILKGGWLEDITLSAIGILLAWRLGLTLVSLSSHYNGGAIVPTMAIGGILGGLLGVAIDRVYPLDYPLICLMSVMGMVVMYAVVFKRPLTGLALVLSLAPFAIPLLAIAPLLLLAFLVGHVLRTYHGFGQESQEVDSRNGGLGRLLWSWDTDLSQGPIRRWVRYDNRQSRQS